MSELWLNQHYADYWRGIDAFQAAASQAGTVYRELEQRQTLAFELGGQRYFIKRHYGVLWREILKNLVLGRLPVVSARNEFVAINALQALDVAVPEPAAYGKRGCLPSRIESFLVTVDVGPHQSLEDYCRHWASAPPSFVHKQELLHAVARIARTMHSAGICHRDFYLCHFLRRESDGTLVLIDLHRALCKARLAARWVIKDLAGLYFSAMDCGLTKRDLLRFMRAYRQCSLRTLPDSDAEFWRKVEERALKLYRKHQQRI